MVAIATTDEKDRRRIRDDLGSTLFVEAGAGTGKTRELIERIVHLVTSGTARLRNVAAITFTESAAAELRDRVRLRLEEAEQDTGGLSDEEHGRCGTALADLDSAAIETLHGFAQRILTSHPLEAGLPPLIEIQDEISASIAFEEHWSAFLDDLLSDATIEDVLLRAFTMGLDTEDIHEVARHFHENWDRLESLVIDEVSPRPIDTAALTADILDITALRAECIAADDKMVSHLEEIEASAKRLAAAGTELDQLRILTEMSRIYLYAGQKGNWPATSINDIRDRLTEAQASRNTILSDAGAAVLPPLLTVMQRFTLDYAAERRANGRLEFHDLLVLAKDLLQHDQAVRTAVHKQFTHLLIDEFQDTDPLQIEIAVLIAGQETAGSSGWQNAQIDEGRLFFVGDPKQSIYRFRRASIELYQTAQERFSPGLVQLRKNFRSVGPVIDWLNDTFAQLMGDGGVRGQANYEHLSPSREALNAGPTLQLIGEPAKGKLPDIRTREAKEIVQVVLSAKAQHWQVEEQAVPRDVRYQDIAILIPTRTSLPHIEDALEAAGIPHRVEARSLVYETQEVRDLLSILRAIDDPTDEVALIAALRSPAFACGDDDLLRFHNEGGRWDYRRASPEALPDSDPVIMAMTALHDLHRRRWWEPINAIVEAVIRERRFFELAFAHRRPRERWQRLRFVLDQSRAFAEAGGRTLRQFIDWAERQAEEGTRVVETVVPEPDDDAVRIMTIHAAKGLEFPIVLLAGLNVEPSSSRKAKSVLWDSTGRLEAAVGRHFRTPGYEAQSQMEDQMDDFEKVRLLYVGATRARDHLIVSLHHKASSSGPKSLAARLYLLCKDNAEFWRDIAAVALPREETSTNEFDDSPEQFTRWSQDRKQRIEALRRVPMRSATEIVKEFRVDAGVDDDPNVQKDPPVEEVPPWRRGRAGTSIGRAVHAVLQSIDLESRADLESAARAQADAEGIAGRWQEIARTVEAALDAPSIREAISGGRYWRELFVSAPIGEAGVEGFIDLLYETDDGLVVVDYKTDKAPSDEDLEASLARYTPQGATYALAIEEALGRTVERCVFVFAAPGRAREQEVVDLRGAIDQVRERVSANPKLNAGQAPGQSQLPFPGLSPE